MNRIPFQNPALRTRHDHEVILRLLDEVVASDVFILRQKVAAFEEQLKECLGVPHVVAVASATDGLKLAMAALEIGPGDAVLTPALSFPAPAGAIAQRRARVAFVDVDPLTGLLDLDDLENRLAPDVRAIMAVHQGCGLVDMPRMREIADRRGLRVVEDSAVCMGARQAGRPVGLWGDLGVWSFYPVKPLGGIGEAGVIVTGDETLARRCRMLRNHGQDGITRFRHHLLGFNSRMDEVTASYLSGRLPALPGLLRRRAEIARRYDDHFRPLVPDVVTSMPAAEEAVIYRYVLLVERREELRLWLAAHGIEARSPWPAPLPLQPGYAALGHQQGDFPGADSFYRRALALPLYPEMSDDQVEVVAATVKEFFRITRTGPVASVVPVATGVLPEPEVLHDPGVLAS